MVLEALDNSRSPGPFPGMQKTRLLSDRDYVGRVRVITGWVVRLLGPCGQRDAHDPAAGVGLASFSAFTRP